MRLLTIAGLVAVAVVSFYLGLALMSRRAPPTGLVDGHLRPCKRRSNCVLTEDRSRSLAPLPVDGDLDAGWARLRSVVASQPHVRIVDEAPDYLHAEAVSPLFGFRDDLEARLDRSSREIHLRSASRIGLADRGTNRRRVEALAAVFSAGGGSR